MRSGRAPNVARQFTTRPNGPFPQLQQDENGAGGYHPAPVMTIRNMHSPRHERWLPHPALAERALIRPWLTDRASLTARIRARCGHFEVKVLRQGLALPLVDEHALLGRARPASALVREVLLCADGVPVVFAHSVLLPRHLRGAWHLVAGLGARPLGAVLFADNSVKRGRLHFKRLGPRDPRWQRAVSSAAVDHPGPLWARRSVFLRRGLPLLVTEVFLPSIAGVSDPTPIQRPPSRSES